MAAVLACDPGGNVSTAGRRNDSVHPKAVLSHRSAAALWRLLPARGGPVDVAVPSTSGKRKRRGIRLHRCGSLSPASVTTRHGIPTTTAARTIADLRRSASPEESRRAARQAEVLGLRIEEEALADGTRSELERLFLRLCRGSKLPMPEVNVHVGPFLVDFLWRDRRLVVETDGYRYHHGREAFEADRDRDLRLKALGYEVIRLSYRQVVDDPRAVADVLVPLLSDA